MSQSESEQMEDIETVVICQCTGRKREERCPAATIYDESRYFRRQWEYAIRYADEIFIQSAKYGLVRPMAPLEYYDRHAKTIEDAEGWAAEIAEDLHSQVQPPAKVEILGGRDYADPLRPHLKTLDYEVVEPLRGQGIGKRQQTLSRLANRSLEDFS